MFFENDRELGRITYPDGTVALIYAVPVTALSGYDHNKPTADLRPWEVMSGLPGTVYVLLEETALDRFTREKTEEFGGDAVRFQQYLFNAASYMALVYLQESGQAPFGP